MVTARIALKWLNNFENPTGRLARWTIELIEYDYEIAYRKGSANLVMDVLSGMNNTGKSVTSILACCVESECKDFVDETGE